MRWTLAHGWILACDEVPPELERQVLAQLAILEANCNHPNAAVLAANLRQALRDRRMPPESTEQLARWCNTGHIYKDGRPYAEAVSRLLFGRTLPRLSRRAEIGGLAASLCGSGEPADSGFPSPAAAPVSSDPPANVVTSRVMSISAASAAVSPRSNTSRGPGKKGSKYCIQRYIELGPEELRDRIICHSASLGAFECVEWEWKSPLRADDYYEYRDDLLQPRGLSQHEDALRRFWPKNGPQWDALASLTGNTGPGALLVEAKAHPAELSTPCGASPASRERIRASLETVRTYMGAAESDWLGWSYQLANRLAFLYSLNEVARVPAWLALISFINDRSHRPTGLPEWRRLHQAALRSLGIHPSCRLLDRIIPVFLEPV